MNRRAGPNPIEHGYTLIVAGLLMHAVNLGGSHYAQYLGMSAGITALVLALQPLVTAVVAAGPFIGERCTACSGLGVLPVFAGVAWSSGTRSISTR